MKGVIQIGETRGERKTVREMGEEEKERRGRGERQGEEERSGIPGAKQLPTLPARRGHIFTPQNVGRRATA